MSGWFHDEQEAFEFEMYWLQVDMANRRKEVPDEDGADSDADSTHDGDSPAKG